MTLTPEAREKARRQLTSARYRRQQSARMREKWADPAFRQKMMAIWKAKRQAKKAGGG